MANKEMRKSEEMTVSELASLLQKYSEKNPQKPAIELFSELLDESGFFEEVLKGAIDGGLEELSKMIEKHPTEWIEGLRDLADMIEAEEIAS